jgi:Domain of unknown function (DUF4279)
LGEFSENRDEASLIVSSSSATRDEIVQCIGAAPSAMWKKGDPIQRSLIKRKEDGWRIESTLPRDRPLAGHINNILSRVYPHLCSFKDFGVAVIWLSTTMDIYGMDRPPIQIDAVAIKRLAELGASLDVDLCNFSAT